MPSKTETYRNETEMIFKLKKGDKIAFARFFDRFSPWVLTLTKELNLNEQKAEEVLLACFVKISNDIQEFDPSKQRFFTWVINNLKSTLNETCSGEIEQLQIRAIKNYVQNNRDLSDRALIHLLMLYKGSLEQLNVLTGISKQELMDVIKNNINQLKK